MLIRKTCPGCGAVCDLDDDLRGYESMCGQCGRTFFVSEQDGPPQSHGQGQVAPVSSAPPPAPAPALAPAPLPDSRRRRLVVTIAVLAVMLFAVSFAVGWLLPPFVPDKSGDKDHGAKPPADGSAQLSTSDFNIAEARKSVVFIKCLTPGLPPAVGSGFLVSADGLIYTNRHVIQPDQPIQ